MVHWGVPLETPPVREWGKQDWQKFHGNILAIKPSANPTGSCGAWLPFRVVLHWSTRGQASLVIGCALCQEWGRVTHWQFSCLLPGHLSDRDEAMSSQHSAPLISQLGECVLQFWRGNPSWVVHQNATIAQWSWHEFSDSNWCLNNSIQVWY